MNNTSCNEHVNPRNLYIKTSIIQKIIFFYSRIDSYNETILTSLYTVMLQHKTLSNVHSN